MELDGPGLPDQLDNIVRTDARTRHDRKTIVSQSYQLIDQYRAFHGCGPLARSKYPLTAYPNDIFQCFEGIGCPVESPVERNS